MGQSTMGWMRRHVRGLKDQGYARQVLARYRLGMKAGGAIQGVRVITDADSCPACSAMAGRIYDPDAAPLLPLTERASARGCRCAYAAVMAYDLSGFDADDRPKAQGYAETVLARYRLGMRAGGAIGGVRVVPATGACAACRALADTVYGPDSAPLIPVAGCTSPGGCRCAYSAVMAYAVPGTYGAG